MAPGLCPLCTLNKKNSTGKQNVVNYSFVCNRPINESNVHELVRQEVCLFNKRTNMNTRVVRSFMFVNIRLCRSLFVLI
ncbi:hypothetical protein HanIR_Chr12g0571931 [Helianthus annuus]|nr:hypothetical protein HanIR_Chr12g0571931 [Helianthus annuus]